MGKKAKAREKARRLKSPPSSAADSVPLQAIEADKGHRSTAATGPGPGGHPPGHGGHPPGAPPLSRGCRAGPHLGAPVGTGGPVDRWTTARSVPWPTNERVTAPSMTRLVTAMEADGLVERIPSAQDGRKVFVRITTRGETAAASRA